MDGTNEEYQKVKTQIMREMMQRAREVFDEHFAQIEDDEQKFRDISCLALAHLANVVNQMIPGLKNELLKLSSALVDLEIADRDMKNGILPIKKEQGPTIEAPKSFGKGPRGSRIIQ